jgi:hypothetical protein
MFIVEMFEGAGHRLVVTYPGRFQPFHLGHLDVFETLAGKFGSDNVYIVTSNKTDGDKSPFNFSDKIRFMHAAGVPNHNVIEVSKPYDLPDQFQTDKENIIFITAVGAPDAQRLRPGSFKKDGTPSYFQEFKNINDCATADQHGYVIIANERSRKITIGGKTIDVSHGTQTRAAWNQVRNSPEQRAEFLKQLYGINDPELGKTLDKIPNGQTEAAAKPSPKLKPVETPVTTEGVVLTKDELVNIYIHGMGKYPGQEIKKQVARDIPLSKAHAYIEAVAKKFNLNPKAFVYGPPRLSEDVNKECPPATQDIALNLKNRQKAIDEYGYGPLNPDLPNRKFWMKKVDEWNLDSADEAKQSLCGNCAAFDVRQDTLDCIAQGIDRDNPSDAEATIDAGDLGYCKFLKFKCASRRTCDAWVTGGPLTDTNEDTVLETAGVGVVKNSKDPRYVMATMGDDNDVDASTLGKMMKGYNLIGKNPANTPQKSVTGKVGKGIKESFSFLKNGKSLISEGLNTDEILEKLTKSYRNCVDHRESYNNFNQIETAYSLLREPLKTGDVTEFKRAWAYVSGKYPDAFDILTDKPEVESYKHDRFKSLDKRKEQEERLLKRAMDDVVGESAMSDLHAEFAEVYDQLAPGIEKHKDSFKAGQLYDALEAVAEKNNAMAEFTRMMRGARNSAHLDYDTNPGGFENWFWYLPFDEQGMAEGSELKQVKRKYNQAAKDANLDQVGAGKKIDTMKKSLRQKDLGKEPSINEFAPPGGDDGNDGFSDETLKRLAAQWWQGDEDPRVEKTLAAAGWEIGQDEGYDNGGAFVVQAGDINGDSYISWPAEELEGLAEAGYGRNRGYSPGFASPHAPSLGGRRREDDEGNSEFDDKMRKITGMIFYNVKDFDKARELGLKQTRSGKWYLPTGNRLAQQVADREFGTGKVWYPQNEGATGAKPGWMLRQDPALAKKVKDSKRGHEALKKWAGKPVPKDAVRENAEELHIGDPVIITGNVEFEGKTGDIDSFGADKRFVVVNLYNHGKHSFHSSNVEYNDYADEEDEDYYALPMPNGDRDLEETLFQYDREDPYNSEFAPDVGMGRMTLRSWKQSLIRRVNKLAQDLESAGQHIDDPVMWENVYKKIQSMNLEPIAKEIELAHAELEKVRRQGGTRSRAFQNKQRAVTELEETALKRVAAIVEEPIRKAAKYVKEDGGTSAGGIATSTGDGNGFGVSIFYKKQKKAKKK